MEMKTEIEQKFTFTEGDIRDLIAASIKEKHGVNIEPKAVRFNIYGGEAGGYGSMGDPMHVYNDPIPASFAGATVVVKTTS